MKDKDRLYFKPEELVIDRSIADIQKRRIIHSRITRLQLEGLSDMGCQVSKKETCTEVTNHSSKNITFYNRLMEITATEKSFLELFQSCTPPVSFEITPFSLPENIETILNNLGAKHTLSTVILGKEILSAPIISDTEHTVRVLKESDDLFESAFSLFSSFFTKPGESPKEAKKRFKENIGKGPHLIAINQNRVIGSIGSILNNGLASVYHTIISPEYRLGIALGLRLGLEMEKSLFEQGVDCYYYKTRNRAVFRGAQTIMGLTNIYTERIYEKN